MKRILIACGVCAGLWYQLGDLALGNQGYDRPSAITLEAMRAAKLPSLDVTVSNIRQGKADVSIANRSGERLASVFLHCAFRDASGARMDVAPIYVADLAAGDTARETASIPGRAIASKVACRIESARRS